MRSTWGALMLTERMILYMTQKEFMSGSELRQYLHISTRKMKYLMDNHYMIDRELHPEIYRAPERWYQGRSNHYNSRVTYRHELIKLSEEERAGFRKYMENEFRQWETKSD